MNYFQIAVESHKNQLLTTKNISLEQWELYAKSLFGKEIKKGDFLCREGDSFTKISWIYKGIFKASYFTEDGKEVIKKFYSESQAMAPYGSIVQEKNSNISIYALEDSYLLQMEYKDLKELYENNPEWTNAARLCAERELIEREEREKELLLSDARERVEKFKERYQTIENRLPQKLIAAYVRISPVSLSRLKNSPL